MNTVRDILVGIVGAAQGVKGEVRVKSYTGDACALGDYGPLKTDVAGQRLLILALRPLRDDMLVVRFEGIIDRDAASALTNTRLYVERERLPPPGNDEFYQVDLIGLMAMTPDGTVVGRVLAVQNHGAGDLLEIAPPTGETVLVPFTKAFVPILDFERGVVTVEPGALAIGTEGNAAQDPGDGEPSA